MFNKKLAYSILKETDKNEWSINNVLEQYSEIDYKELKSTIGTMKTRELMTGISYGSNDFYDLGVICKPTEKGEEFLEENNGWKKFYKGLKEIRDWIK